MAAKATRIHTLVLLIALTVAAVTSTVMVAPPVASAGTSGPTTSGDPDRPNDCPKPAAQYSTSNTGVTSVVVETGQRGAKSETNGWSWAMNFIATLLGRHGL